MYCNIKRVSVHTSINSTTDPHHKLNPAAHRAPTQSFHVAAIIFYLGHIMANRGVHAKTHQAHSPAHSNEPVECWVRLYLGLYLFHTLERRPPPVEHVGQLQRPYRRSGSLFNHQRVVRGLQTQFFCEAQAMFSASPHKRSLDVTQLATTAVVLY